MPSKLPLLIALTLPFLGWANASAQPVETLRFACNEFPPHKMASSEDGLPGFDVEIITQALAHSNIAVEVQFFPWKRALENTKSGQSDALCSCSKSQERDQWLAYSDTMGTVGIGYFHYGAKLDHITLPDLSPVAVVRGYAIQKDLVQKGVKIIRVNDDRAGVRMLTNNRVKSFYTYRDTGKYFLSKHKFGTNVTYSEVKNSPYFACFSKSNPNYQERVEKFNTGLEHLRQTGIYDQIIAKYQ